MHLGQFVTIIYNSEDRVEDFSPPTSGILTKVDEEAVYVKQRDGIESKSYWSGISSVSLS